MSDPMDFLLLTKGPLFNLAVTVFALGMAARILEILVNGRRPNYSEARGGQWLPGLRTVVTRSVADPGTFKRAPFNVVVGWLWHLGFIVTLQRGAEWAATGKVTNTAIPADFPGPDKVSLRPNL